MSIESLYTADAHDEGSECPIKDQSGKPIDLFIKMAGIDSTVYRNALREQGRKRFTREGQEEPEDYDLNILVAATMDWRGEVLEGLEFSKERVKELYEKAPYIRDQIVLFTDNRANFIKG